MKRPSRRTLLRGAGVTLALPWLEAMDAAETSRPLRAAFIYIPNGVIEETWRPRETGVNYRLPSALEPLAPVRDHVSVLSGLDRTYTSGTSVHAQCGSCWLTSSPPEEVLDGGFPTNISVDQMLAQKLGADTPLPSIELSCNNRTDNKETRYFESISWLAPGYAANVEKDPRAAFERLFGRIGQDAESRSVLDAVREAARSLESRLGKADRVKLDEYFSSVRAVERRIQLSERQTRERPGLSVPAPAGMPEDRGEYIRLMMDLILLAFQQDRTRVATLVIDPERWDTPRMYHGVFDKPQDHHALTHTKGDEAIEMLTKIDRFHVQQFAYLAQRLGEVQEGGVPLSDSSVFVMGSGLGDGSIHSYKDLPTMLTGNLGGRIRNGLHLSYPDETPLANLWMTVLDSAGVEAESFADSHGRLEGLSA